MGKDFSDDSDCIQATGFVHEFADGVLHIANRSNTYKWCLWPRRCHKTNRWLFCELAIKEQVILKIYKKINQGPDQVSISKKYRWYDKNEWVILKLKG
jgi:hypothetical protein